MVGDEHCFSFLLQGTLDLAVLPGGTLRKVGLLHWLWPKHLRSQWLKDKPDEKIFINMT